MRRGLSPEQFSWPLLAGSLWERKRCGETCCPYFSAHALLCTMEGQSTRVLFHPLLSLSPYVRGRSFDTRRLEEKHLLNSEEDGGGGCGGGGGGGGGSLVSGK